MLEINEYFEGKVKSIGFRSENGPVSSGVMAVGAYTFSTSQHELMKVIHGELLAKLPDSDEFKACELQVSTPTAYLCYYS